MKPLPYLIFLAIFFFGKNAKAQLTWGSGGMLGILEESLSYIDMGGENNLDQNGVQTYFTNNFDKARFDRVFNETAEYGWDTVVYHYLNALWYLNRPDLDNARKECYQAGKAYTTTSSANRNVLSRYGLPLDRINHLREYIDLGEHRTNKSLGFDGGDEVKGYTGYSDAHKSTVPAFQWPPPMASTDCVLPKQVIGEVGTLGEMDAKISHALSTCGYYEKSYYRVPSGFAVVTRIEQFNDDGSPKSGDDRWNVTLKPSKFDLEDYLQALFWGRSGKYRIIVFVVTAEAFHEGNETVSREGAIEWLRTGAKYLPASLANQSYTSQHRCTTLVYEFELKESLSKPRFLNPSTQPGQVHMQRSGIWGHMK